MKILEDYSITEIKNYGKNVFELVITKEDPMQFRIKTDAYSHFNWKGRKVVAGIIKY